MAIVNYDEAALARQRALAEQLRQGAMTGTGGAGMQGQVYIVGNQLGNVAQGLGSVFLNRDAKKKEGVLQGQRDAEVSQWAASKPSMMNPDNTPKAFPQLMQEMSDWQARGVTSKNPAILKAALKGLEDYGDMPYKMETLKVGGEQKAMLQEGRLASAQMLLDQKLAQAQSQFERTTDLKEKLALREELFELQKLQAQLDNKLTEMKVGNEYKIEHREDEQAHQMEVKKLEEALRAPENSKKVQEDIGKIDGQLQLIDAAIKDVESNRGAFGLLVRGAEVFGDVGQSVLNATSKDSEIAARTKVGQIAAEEIKRISGAAVTSAEQPRLEKYLPASRDSARVTLIKLNGMRLVLNTIRNAMNAGRTVSVYEFDKIDRETGIDEALAGGDNPDQVGATVMGKEPTQRVTATAAPGAYPAPIIPEGEAPTVNDDLMKRVNKYLGQ